MPNGLIEGYEKILKIFFGDEHKKSISAVIYFTAGIIGLWFGIKKIIDQINANAIAA